jgi:hypothetical protein
MAKHRRRRRLAPPRLVVMTGPPIAWSEATWSRRPAGPREFFGRANCPAGCASRDLARERAIGLERLCLLCLTYTNDPPGWRMPTPLAVVIANRKTRCDQARQATFAYRKFRGRKAARTMTAR